MLRKYCLFNICLIMYVHSVNAKNVRLTLAWLLNTIFDLCHKVLMDLSILVFNLCL